MDFNKIRDLLVDLAKKNGITREELEKEVNPGTDTLAWTVEWTDDLNESFRKDIARLESAVSLHESALENGDLLAAKAGLIHIAVQLHNLESSINSLRKAVKKSYIDQRFNWPAFPDSSYKVPPQYGYKE